MSHYHLTSDWTHWVFFLPFAIFTLMMCIGALWGWDRWHPIRWARNRIYRARHTPYDWSERDPQLVGRHVRKVQPYRRKEAS